MVIAFIIMVIAFIIMVIAFIIMVIGFRNPYDPLQKTVAHFSTTEKI